MRPQHVVAGDGGGDRTAQAVLVEVGRRDQRYALEEAVEHRSGLAGLGEPAQDRRRGDRPGRRHLFGRLVDGCGLHEQGSECFDGAVGEHVAGPQRETLRADPADHPDRDDTVSAQGEEVVVHTDGGPVECVGERLAQQSFPGGAGWSKRPVVGDLRCGKGTTIGFPVGGQRYPVERDEQGRDHVVRQPGVCPVGDLAVQCRVVGVGVGGDEVTDQMICAAVAVDVDDGLAHRGVVGELGLDLLQFDSPATDLDLVVGAAQEFQRAVGGPPGQVSGAVHPGAVVVEGVGDEPRRGQR